MKTTVSFCLLITCILATSSHPAKRLVPTLHDWITYQVDSQFSVQLPVQPNEKDWKKFFASQGVVLSTEQLEKLKDMKVLSATDGIANYGITTASGIFSNRLKSSDRASYYDGAINGLLLKEQDTLLQRSAFTVNGYDGVEISYKAVRRTTGEILVKHQRILIVDKVIYSLAVDPVDKNNSMSTALTERRTKFFNSIVCKSRPKP